MAKPIPHLLSLALVERFEPLAKELGVSEVARSKRGFLTAYKEAGGEWSALDPWWQNRRNNFVKRHMAQVELRQEPLFQEDGTPTRRHLGLIMWAHSPLTEKQLEKTMRRKNPPLEWHLQHEDPREVVRGLIQHHGQRAVLDEAFARQNPEWAKKLGEKIGRGEKATREGYRHYAPIVKERARQARKYLQESRRDLMDGYRAMRQNPDDEPRILKSYTIYTEESIEQGDAAEHGWDDEEGVSCIPDEYDMEEGTAAVDLAVRHLENEGAIHASSSHASRGVWYSTEVERHGDEIIEYSFHLRGFTPEEEIEIARRMGLR